MIGKGRRNTEATSPRPRITVTEAHIVGAIRSHSGGCMVVQAIKEQRPEMSSVMVDVATTRMTDAAKGLRYFYETPAAVQNLLLGFDQGWDTAVLNPVTFTLGRALKITNVVAQSKSKVERRRERLAELTAKEVTGTLTGPERGVLTKMRRHDVEHPPRDTSNRGVADIPGDGLQRTVVGGSPIPLGPPNPQLLRSTTRIFGARQADPGALFRDAVDAEVAKRMAALGDPAPEPEGA